MKLLNVFEADFEHQIYSEIIDKNIIDVFFCRGGGLPTAGRLPQ